MVVKTKSLFTWTADDIKNLKPQWDTDTCEMWLEELQLRMLRAGYEVVVEIIKTEYNQDETSE